MKIAFYQIGVVFSAFASVITPACANAEVSDRLPHLYLVGDSTMFDRRLDKPTPGRGWGQMFKELLRDPTRATNLAKSGRSSKSFIDEGAWAAAMGRFQPGDYVIIQFGGNDQKKEDPRRFAAPDGAFKANMTRFVTDVRRKGAFPVLATSVVRRKFDGQGILIDTYAGYTEVVRAIAKEQNVPLLDMNRETTVLLRKYGPDESKKLFMWIKPGEYELYPNGQQDDSHTSKLGAELFAAIAVSEIKAQQLPLAEWLK
ncbi:MAG: rhamnogalacturonan acetylesterase [Verrucomicrobiota bacterium]